MSSRANLLIINISDIDSYISILLNIILPDIEAIFKTSYNLTLVFKKEDELNKGNYLPVSVPSHSSKIFERIVFNEMNLVFQFKLSPVLTGFRKHHSKQNGYGQKGWYYVYGSVESV